MAQGDDINICNDLYCRSLKFSNESGQLSQYCRNHKCPFPDCLLGGRGNDRCTMHICAAIYSYCYKLKEQFQAKINNNDNPSNISQNFCSEHKCPVKGCSLSVDDCKEHLCRPGYMGCSNLKVSEEINRCAKHICTFPDCPTPLEGKNPTHSCPAHHCRWGGCLRPRQVDKDLCSFHGCEEPGCLMETKGPNRCQLHLCQITKRHGCPNLKLVGGNYCLGHTCTYFDPFENQQCKHGQHLKKKSSKCTYHSDYY